ncbi:MAG: LCP family protein [Chloroflexota bacterium]
MHARRIRPDAGHLDRRRLTAAGLSAVFPGLGQAFNRRRRLAIAFLAPAAVLGALAALLWLTQSPAMLAARAAAPAVLSILLTLNLVILVARIVAVIQAFLDTRWHGPTGRLGVGGIVAIALLVVIPHLAIHRYGTAFGETFDQVFDGGTLGAQGAPSGPSGPGVDERLNVLLLGIDALPWRPATLTDTMMVASLDPVGKTVTIVSVPRDLINVPLGNGNEFGPKLNSLMSYADRNPDEFPQGGIRALQDAIGALLGIKIHYYARLDFYGFVKIVDAVGGVVVDVKEGFDDPTYDGFGLDQRGYSIEAGRHRLDGLDALAYARARKAAGESDFTRAGRQQQVLLALRDAAAGDGSLLWELPDLLEAVGDTVTTDLPSDLLPQLAAVADEIGDGGIVRAIIRHPLLKSRNTRYGSSLVPNLKAIREVAAHLFPAPGVAPIPWPTPKPSPTPRPSPTG